VTQNGVASEDVPDGAELALSEASP
jgi:hypothetical protein